MSKFKRHSKTFVNVFFFLLFAQIKVTLLSYRLFAIYSEFGIRTTEDVGRKRERKRTSINVRENSIQIHVYKKKVFIMSKNRIFDSELHTIRRRMCTTVMHTHI